jgi:hypothetical protein
LTDVPGKVDTDPSTIPDFNFPPGGIIGIGIGIAFAVVMGTVGLLHRGRKQNKAVNLKI